MNTNKFENITSFLKRLKWKRIIIIILSLVTVFVFSFGAYFAWGVYKETDDFDADKLVSGQASKIVDANGTTFYNYGSDENGKRINVDYEQLPQVLVDAIVAGEDSRFFAHDGFDLPRIAKAALGNLTAGGITSGGSTITQQVIKKSYFPLEEQTYTRKISEVFLAMEATKQVSKEEILTLYLNKIYFGRSMSSVGVAAASKYYFNKDVSQLTLPEAALLAGTLNSPNNYDPYYDLELATKRRNVILNLMVDHGYITQEESENAKKVEVQNMLDQGNIASTTAYQAYIDIVNDEAKEKTGLDPTEVEMNIYTYMNADIQTYLDELTNGGKFKFANEYMQVGASVQSTKDGRIVGVIAGRNNVAFGTNRADTKQQPGSALKPILDYGAAFEFLNWSTGHQVEDKAYTKKSGWNPKNWDGQVHGTMSITEALKQSWNLPAVWTFDAVLEEIGSQGVYEYLEGFGVDMSKESKDGIEPAFAIGGWAEGITPITLASMYATIGNNGSYVEPHTISHIEIVQEGKTIYVDEDIQNDASQAISEEAAFMIREVQSGYNYTELADGIVLSKTGTTNYGPEYPSLSGSAKDSWLAAYNPDYSFAVWMGYDAVDVKDYGFTMDAHTLRAREFAAAIYKKLAENGVTNSFPSQPAGVINAQMVVGTYPYMSPSANTPSSKIISAWFKRNYGPGGIITDLGINELTSFDASINGDGLVNVNFSAYNPIEATTDSNANDATKLYGKVVYVAEITDATTNELLYSETLGTNSATLNYKPTNKVIVSGYYTYEDATNIRSSVLSKTIGNAPTLNAIAYSMTSGNVSLGSTVSLDASGKATIKVSVTPQSSSSVITVSLLSGSGESLGTKITLNNSAPSCTIPIEAAGKYKIQIDESANGIVATPVVVSFSANP